MPGEKPHWVEEKDAKYFERRADDPKEDLEYLDEAQREAHICTTVAQIEYYCAEIIQLANQCALQKKLCLLFVDTEKRLRRGHKSPIDQFNWDRVRFLKKGETLAQIQERIRNTHSIRKSHDTEAPHRKALFYWEIFKHLRSDGILEGAVEAISVACTADPEGKFTFSIKCGDVIRNDYDGYPRLPSCFYDLLKHPALLLCNVSMAGDIEAIVQSFCEDEELKGLRYVEAQEVAARAWGTFWLGTGPDGIALPGGVLTMIEHQFVGKTMYKPPSVTNSDWNLPWTAEQKRYTLEDAELIKNVFVPEVGKLHLADLVYYFPYRPMGKAEIAELQARERMGTGYGPAPKLEKTSKKSKKSKKSSFASASSSFISPSIVIPMDGFSVPPKATEEFFYSKPPTPPPMPDVMPVWPQKYKDEQAANNETIAHPLGENVARGLGAVPNPKKKKKSSLVCSPAPPRSPIRAPPSSTPTVVASTDYEPVSEEEVDWDAEMQEEARREIGEPVIDETPAVRAVVVAEGHEKRISVVEDLARVEDEVTDVLELSVGSETIEGLAPPSATQERSASPASPERRVTYNPDVDDEYQEIEVDETLPRWSPPPAEPTRMEPTHSEAVI